MTTIYARILPKTGVEKFFRCGIEFSRQWQALSDLDKATTKRLNEEQMLEVATEQPEDFEPAAPAEGGEGAGAADAKAKADAAPAKADKKK